MSIYFPSKEWAAAMMDEVNQSEAYESAAQKWEGDFFFIIEPGGKLQEEATVYMDLWHGECRNAYLLEHPNGEKPAYLLSGPVATWKRVMTKQLDPMQAMMTGQLKLKGDMAMVMKNVRAAKELVECCTRVPTEFPI